MTWKITPGWTPADSNAAAYIAAVEAADGQALENGVKVAIDNFVLGCKADGIWNAIKASCILSGARTLAGALVPLVGAAPTSFNFVAGDYNRKTGLIGDGSTKYLRANINNTALPQNSKSLSTWVSNAASNTGFVLLGSANVAGRTSLVQGVPGDALQARLSANTGPGVAFNSTGFVGGNRADSANISIRSNGLTTASAVSSASPSSAEIGVFNNGEGSGSFAGARLAFYSMGEALDLALLDARVTTLINAIAAAIP